MHGAPVSPLPIIAMASFRRLMAYQGQFVDLARMCVDRQYGFACLAAAYQSSDERLRRAAQSLFATYDSRVAVYPAH
jgi:hypothetical protein